MSAFKEKASGFSSDLRKRFNSVKEDFSSSDDFLEFLHEENVKRPIVAISLIGIVVLAGIFVFSESSVSPTSETHVVEFTDRGFDPVEVVVDRGDTVRFVDNASITMWVASDPYPTNIGYSNTTRKEHCADNSTVEAFDQCSTGEVYEFTFEKSGEWGYHNQKPFASGGRVVVK